MCGAIMPRLGYGCQYITPLKGLRIWHLLAIVHNWQIDGGSRHVKLVPIDKIPLGQVHWIGAWSVMFLNLPHTSHITLITAV